MRLTLLAFALAAATSLGCTSMTSRPVRDQKTPVALGKPSVSQRIMYNRLQEGQKVAGETTIEGALVR